MVKQTTECVFCGKELEWKQELFAEGGHGEPVCEDCKGDE
ncbi:hypothetical protein AJ85_00365 [Alkalihalobacillus alcalophilus ATCC 27647 = CGMCC 1.3604]|uniref:Uncharacterized protein n=1 Tax=Alkalihalobacillus alcalophilus ATCC 27647 = CGMCC 1.3604 TaxID=1218173 RepID=A0A4S4JYN3_ALKAL|nr:hypothetical protein BH791_gp55 [Bacillus phage BalMu-1]AJA42433.1 hypothetical protein BalMu1_B55 [Bacillus phage BalMu-1]AJA42489.1 hypothetical protein BalMu1_A55 [Bacillus phage BalMu-1]THG88719.1 hypothetical protein AJ85_00365 [Alkalihalobacillus alcalophilus ATCC 27647 = CGMCC 1.3604]